MTEDERWKEREMVRGGGGVRDVGECIYERVRWGKSEVQKEEKGKEEKG